MQRHVAVEALGARELARQVDEHRSPVRQTGERIGERVLLRLLEDDRVVDDGSRLLGDPLDQPAVIFGIAVRVDVIQRQAADELVVEEQRAHDRRFQLGARRDAGRFERDSRIGVDDRAAIPRDPARRAPVPPPC